MNPQKNPDSQFIQTMFDGLAKRYDLFNHLTSMGLASQWRKEAVSPAKQGMRVLDLGCGTGDLLLEAIKRIGPSGEVVGLDFSRNMLSFAEERCKRMGLNGHPKRRFVLRKAEELPIEEEPYDLVVSGFVLRNIYENIDPILSGVFRSLKQGGMISFLDITKSQNGLVALLWKFYMNTVVALYGKILFGKDYPSFYLTQSAERFLNAPEFVKKLEQHGFKKIQTKPFMFGVVTLYQAVK